MTRPDNTGSEYVDAMRGVLERAAKSDAASGHIVEAKQPFLSRPPVALAVFVLFVATIVFNVRFSGRGQPDISPAAAEASAQVSVMIATQVVEQYRQENGALPTTLEDVGLEADQFEYRPDAEGHFELGNAVGGSSIMYNSREGPTSLLRDLGIPLDAPQPIGNRE